MFWTILSDGKLHHSVPEGTTNAVRRDYETSSGEKGVKFELLAESIKGKIENLLFYEGDYGKQLQIYFAKEKPEDRRVVLSLSMAGNFGEDFTKKLQKIDEEKEIKLVPYSFEDENKRKKRGITVYQDNIKIQGYYHEVKKGKNGKDKLVNINGYPEVPKEAEKWASDDWKLFFLQARKFLVSEVEKHSFYNVVDVRAPQDPVVEYPEESNATADKF